MHLLTQPGAWILNIIRTASEDKLTDFSLHLEPDDLNFLVVVAAEGVQADVRSLREYLDTTTFYFDSVEGGAYSADQIIIRLFAMFDEHDATNAYK